MHSAYRFELFENNVTVTPIVGLEPSLSEDTCTPVPSLGLVINCLPGYWRPEPPLSV